MRKQELRDRLATMQVLDRVLPATPLPAAARAASIKSFGLDQAGPLASSSLDQVRAASRRHLDEIVSSADMEGDVTEELLESEELREQAAGFASVGLTLFRASGELVARPLSERRNAGANGVVTRVMRDDKDRLLLETEKAIVRFADGVSAQDRQDILEKFGARELDSRGLPPNAFRVLVFGSSALAFSMAILEFDEVLYAEPDFVEYIGTRHRPSDPEYSLQWHLHNATTPGADLGLEAAWDFATGAGVSIAVIDNGFDIDHADLRFDTLSGWYRPTANLDDADFVRGTAGMPPGDHGTACAGMAAGTSGNGSGGCGVAFGAALHPIACITDQVGTQSTLARALAYAADPRMEDPAEPAGAGADVIACSLGPNGANWSMREILRDAIDFAVREGRGGRGTAVFWACTNGPYPIAFDEVCSHSAVIAVGRSSSIDQDDGCGYGPELAFLAPGVDVYLPTQGGGYATTTGTSFACPCAAGVAALVLEANPTYTYQALRAILADNSDRVGSLPYPGGRNDRFGAGRLNADRAVAAARAAAAGG